MQRNLAFIKVKMKLIECYLNNNMGELLFDEEFTHIKIQIIQNDPNKISDKKIKELLNDYIEVKFSKPKRKLNVEINKTSDFFIFTIVEVDNKSFNKSFKVEIDTNIIKMSDTNNKFEMETSDLNAISKDMIQSGLTKILQKSHVLTNRKQCSIKNENIFAYITRKCSNTN